MTINPETRNRRSIRLRDYDYASAGAYFITIVTRERRCLFGEVSDGEMRLNHWGENVQNEWEQSARIRNEIGLDAFVVMPNHVHGIMVITNSSERATRRSPLHSGPTKRSLGVFVGGFKSAVTKSIRELQGELGTVIWQRNYFEHIIRNDESLERIRRYIQDNPARWEFDRENPLATAPEPENQWQVV